MDPAGPSNQFGRQLPNLFWHLHRFENWSSGEDTISMWTFCGHTHATKKVSRETVQKRTARMVVQKRTAHTLESTKNVVLRGE